MTRLRTLTIAALGAISLSATLSAQPALERLERQLQAEPGVPGAPRTTSATTPEPGYLGVLTRDTPPPGSYVEIRELVADGPAARAGLKQGDLIIRIENRPTRQMADLAAVLQRSVAGDTLEFTILRGQDEHRLLVTLGRRPVGNQRQSENPRPAQGGQADSQELPAPAPSSRKPIVPPIENGQIVGPIIQPPANANGGDDRSRIERLEKRLAELERRLAEIEDLLRRANQ